MASCPDPGNAVLRLFLYRKLEGVYRPIDYLLNVVFCSLRIIEEIMTELEDVKHVEETSNHCQVNLLG